MCCILALGGLIGPRVALVFAWIFTNEVDQAFDSFWLPFLGLIFFPWTTLMYLDRLRADHRGHRLLGLRPGRPRRAHGHRDVLGVGLPARACARAARRPTPDASGQQTRRSRPVSTS